jgi:2-polyprenyl-3-methyl-5-hydroxy-6-metoxy-1,4-benzoquinol methylase
MSQIRPIIKKVVNPFELVKIIKLQRNRKKTERVRDDAQLKLYSQILKGDFLHYGYFDDPAVQAEDISLNDIYKAQHRYAELLVEKIKNTQDEILDIGCGMGGLLKLLQEKGTKPVALTPDNTQIHYISQKYPEIQHYHCKFEDIPVKENINRYGTVITSESLQYLDLDKSLPLLHKISKPDATWIACDYFRIGDGAEKSGHYWNAFLEKLKIHGWELKFEQDITPNILPTIAYVHLWGHNIGLPLFNFALEKLEIKQPGIYYAIKNIFPFIKQKIDKNLITVNPKIFAENKKYKLMVFEKIVS